MSNLVLYLVLLVAITDLVLADDFKLLLLHNNDMHGRFEETSVNSGTCQKSDKNRKCVGGFARTVHEVRRYRRLADEGEVPPVLFLNAGDTYVGTAWFSVFKWKICAEFINALKPDVMSFGNHEFDNGIDGLYPFVNNISCPIVAANLDFSKIPEMSKVQKSVVLEINGHKIGVIGHLTTETQQISAPGDTIFNNEVDSVRIESEKLDLQGVKIIFALGHSGYLVDKKIAMEVPLVDVVVGGHTNTFLWNGAQPSLESPEDPYPKVVTQKSGKKVPVVQAYAYTKYLGRLNLTFDGTTGDLKHFSGQPLLLDSSIPQDQDILDKLEGYRTEIEALNSKVVGRSKVILDGNATVCRFMECNFGNMIADAFVYYVATVYAGKYWTKAPIGLVNGGGIRNTINPFISNGTITRGELLGAIPFGSNVITLQMNGSDLRRTLEIGVRSQGETSAGEFLQVSGLRVVYDRSKPPFHRVVSVKARCGECEIPQYVDLDPKKVYTIVTTSFLVDGGDAHTVLKENSFNRTTEDLNDIDTVEWYLQKQSPVYPEIQGRIQFVQAKDTNGNMATGIKPLGGVLLAFIVFIKLF